MQPRNDGAGSNPPAGGSSANTPATNPLAGGLPNQTPATPQGQPAGTSSAGSNPPAGGSSDKPENQTHAPNGTRPDVEAEWKRENQALRKRLEALEAEKKAEEDAKLTESERKDKQLAELQRANAEHAAERQQWLLERAVIDEANVRRLHDVQATVLLLRQEYGDQLDYDEHGVPVNVSKMLDRLLEKRAWLAAPEPPPPPQAPNSGRMGSPPRTPTGQYASARNAANPTPVPPSEWPTLNEIQWSQPKYNPGEPGEK